MSSPCSSSSPSFKASTQGGHWLAGAFLLTRLSYAYGYYKKPASKPTQLGAGITSALSSSSSTCSA